MLEAWDQDAIMVGSDENDLVFRFLFIFLGECGSLIQNGLHKLIYLNTWSQLVEIFGKFRQCGPCWRRCVTKSSSL